MKYVVYSVIALIALSGCATRNKSESEFNNSNQTPNLSIDSYKSPELRSVKQLQTTSVAVAISGGGHRAGNFGIGVLRDLENITCKDKSYDVLREIDYLSTVSGGGLAAGAYISTLYDHAISNNNTEYSLSDLLKDQNTDLMLNMKRGYHNKLVSALVNLQSIGNLDRGDFLEEEFDKKFLGYDRRNRSLTLGDVFISNESENTPSVPMWIANATIYENGSIFPFHPASLKEYDITQYTHHLDKKMINSNYFSMPLSVGLKASASFPGVVPATTLISKYDPQNQHLHLFDGGLSDNLGINTAMSMLASKKSNKKVLLIIDAFNGQSEPFSSNEGSPTILQILLRTTGISLDAWRIRHKNIVETLSTSNDFNGKNVNVIYLAFDDLPKDVELATQNIGTNFKISKSQQETLFKAARIVVDDNKDVIIKSIFGKSCI